LLGSGSFCVIAVAGLRPRRIFFSNVHFMACPRAGLLNSHGGRFCSRQMTTCSLPFAGLAPPWSRVPGWWGTSEQACCKRLRANRPLLFPQVDLCPVSPRNRGNSPKKQDKTKIKNRKHLPKPTHLPPEVTKPQTTTHPPPHKTPPQTKKPPPIQPPPTTPQKKHTKQKKKTQKRKTLPFYSQVVFLLAGSGVPPVFFPCSGT